MSEITRHEFDLLQKMFDMKQNDWLESCCEISNLKDENQKLRQALDLAMEALEKIDDPRKRDHTEPDLYTRYGCVINIAGEALAKIREVVLT